MRLRRLSPVLGSLLVAPLFVILPVGPTTATPAPTPVSGQQADAPLVEATQAVAQGAAPVTTAQIETARSAVVQGSAGAKTLPAGATVLKAVPPQASNPRLAAVAISWQAGTGKDVAVQVRSKRSGAWSEWETLEVDPAADAGAPREGSELYMVTGATEVEGRVLGAPGHEPGDAKMTVIDPGSSAADAAPGAPQAGAANAVTPRPNIYTRQQWGADESWRVGTPTSNNPKGIVIHHTADTNNYTADMVPGMLRSMYRYATQTLGWDDIAYNFIIDRWGRIWQGRAWLYPEQPVFPAAQYSNNDRGVGISLLGNYETEPFSTAARSSLVKLIAWKASLHGINPQGTTTWFNNKTGKYETGPTIVGHRDQYFTACPGANVYPAIPGIRREVASLVGTSGISQLSASVFRDFDGMGDTDVLGIDNQGRLILSSPDGAGDMTPPETIGGGGWEAFDVATIAGDWDGDGNADVIARKAATGELYLYPGDGRGGFAATRRIGTGWNGMQTIVAPGDWNGDGHPDLIGVNKYNGNMYFYAADGKGGYAQSGVQIGHGWQNIKSFAGVGDWNGDRKADLVGMTFSGLGVVYYGDGRGSFADQKTQSGSWSGYTTLTGVRNAYGDDAAAVLAYDASGRAAFGVRAGETGTTFKRIGRSFAGYDMYAG